MQDKAPDLDGITIITGPNCVACIKLINMMKKEKIKHRTKTQQELRVMKIQSIPVILIDGVRIFEGCPGSVKELRKLLRG